MTLTVMTQENLRLRTQGLAQLHQFLNYDPKTFWRHNCSISNMIDLLGGFALATKYLETHSMPHHGLQDDNNRSPKGTNASKK